MKNNSYTIIFIMIMSFLFASCGSGSEEQSKEEKPAYKVEVFGELRKVMHGEEIGGQVALDSLDKSYLYGIGAIEGLKGELTILNGQVYQARVDSLGLKISLADSVRASLLVTAQVGEWDTLVFQGVANVDSLLSTVAAKRDLGEDLAFIILAKPQQMNYHVINFTGDKPNHKNHKQGSLSGGISKEEVKIIGLYSEKAAGIYTHMGSKTHMHFVSVDEGKSGHVDKLDLGEAAFKLLIPKL